MSLKLSNKETKVSEVPQKYKNPMVHLLSGSISGLLSAIVLQPFDLVKTRLQQTNNLQQNLGLIGKVKSIYFESGVKGYWKGTVPTLIRNVPGMGLYFASFDQTKNFLKYLKTTTSLKLENSENEKLTKLELLSCGVVARTGVGIIMNPISIVKVRYESNLYSTSSIMTTLRHIVSQQGVKGLFSGFGATALRDAPYAGIYIYFYELGKENLKFINTNKIGNEPNPIVNLISGMSAGFLATTLTHPFDMLKTRIQLHPTKYPNLIKSINIILKEEGIMSLYQGMMVRTLRKSLSSAITWTCYEQIVSYINSYY